MPDAQGYADSLDYHDYILEVEFTAGSGTFEAICGLMDYESNLVNNLDETEIPNCNDESQPHKIEYSTRSQAQTVSGTGVYALSSDKKLRDWARSGATLLARIRNNKVTLEGSAGDYEIEEGPAILQSLGYARTKGQAVASTMEIQFDGLPALTAKI